MNKAKIIQTIENEFSLENLEIIDYDIQTNQLFLQGCDLATEKNCDIRLDRYRVDVRWEGEINWQTLGWIRISNTI